MPTLFLHKTSPLLEGDIKHCYGIYKLRHAPHRTTWRISPPPPHQTHPAHLDTPTRIYRADISVSTLLAYSNTSLCLTYALSPSVLSVSRRRAFTLCDHVKVIRVSLHCLWECKLGFRTPNGPRPNLIHCTGQRNGKDDRRVRDWVQTEATRFWNWEQHTRLHLR